MIWIHKFCIKVHFDTIGDDFYVMIMHGVHKFMGSMSTKTLNYAKVL
jgi:hypothetical protein